MQYRGRGLVDGVPVPSSIGHLTGRIILRQTVRQTTKQLYGNFHVVMRKPEIASSMKHNAFALGVTFSSGAAYWAS